MEMQSILIDFLTYLYENNIDIRDGKNNWQEITHDFIMKNKENMPNDREVKMRREQITDINQWTEILIKYRHKIRERVLWSMINDINNRTTD